MANSMACGWRYSHYTLADCKISLVDYQETKNEMEKLNCKSLMIGDWVFCTYPSINKPVRVAEIKTVGDNKLKIVIDDDIRLVFNETYIEPIPLTPEILEKNGFGFTKNDNKDSVWNGWWIYKGLELATACLDKEGNWPCFINIYDSNIKCDYVHQLQHALHLCEIEKEIIL